MTREAVWLLWDVIERAGGDAFRQGRMLVALALYLEAEEDYLGRVGYEWTGTFEGDCRPPKRCREAVRRAWQDVFGHGGLPYGRGKWPAQELARTAVGLPLSGEQYEEVYLAAARARRLARLARRFRGGLTPIEAVTAAIALVEEQSEPVYGRAHRVAPLLREMRRVAEICEAVAAGLGGKEDRWGMPFHEACLPSYLACYLAYEEIEVLEEEDRFRRRVDELLRSLQSRVDAAHYGEPDRGGAE